jgi:DNA-binding IclR family transcriptional regulator
MARDKTRTDASYEIDALAKGLRVLEALHDAGSLALQTKRIQNRCGHSTDFCMRALKTLKIAGYVAEVEGGWKLTPKVTRIFRNSEFGNFQKATDTV